MKRRRRKRGRVLLLFLIIMALILCAMAGYLMKNMAKALDDTESVAEIAEMSESGAAAENGSAAEESPSAENTDPENAEEPQGEKSGETENLPEPEAEEGTGTNGENEPESGGSEASAESEGTAESEASAESAAARPKEVYKPGIKKDNRPVYTKKNGHKVAIDAGHQAHGNSEQEAIGPGSSSTKPKVASGTHGRASGLDEYELNLIVSLQLRDELEKRGYEVYMIRETHDVNISNRERAEAAAESGADILVRVHANGSDNRSLNGTLNYQPGTSNPYLSQDVIEDSRLLSRLMLDAFVKETGAKNLGLLTGDDMTGINWSKIPVTIVEMGFMSNEEEDLKMASAEYQEKMVRGMANGIDEYFKEKDSE